MIFPANDVPKGIPRNRRIRTPGVYFLKRDLVVDKNVGISITCSNVVLDLQGHSLSHARGAAPDSFGILAKGCHNLTIMNGAIEGFWHGIHLTGARNAKIFNTQVCRSGYIGLCVQGEDVRIHDNIVEEPRLDLARTSDRYSVGIHVQGHDLSVTRNRLNIWPTVVEKDVEYVAILVGASTDAGEVSANIVRSSGYFPKSYGVWVGDRCHVAVTENEISNVQFAIASTSRATRATNNYLKQDRLHADTYGVYIRTNIDAGLIEGNRIEGIEFATFTQRDTSDGTAG